MRFYCFLAALLLLVGCKTLDESDKMDSNKSTDVRQEVEEIDPQIVFLYFEIEKRTAGNPHINLTQTQVTEGKLKENTIRHAPKANGNLILQLLDENNHIQVEQIIKNPLVKNIEQYSEDGEITLNRLELEHAQFFIRFNHKDVIQTLKIYSIQSGNPVEVYHKPLQL